MLFGGFQLYAQRTCATHEKTQELMQTVPGFAAHHEEMKAYLRNTSQTHLFNKPNAPQVVVTIPVVFHVLYKNATQNISDAQILSQLAVLNADYRKLNTDFNSVVPSAFRPLGADMEITFCLATRTPTGAVTTGITRKSVASSFSFDNNYYAASGQPAWDPTKYLNIWVGKFTDNSLLGFAYLPDSAGANYDGLCISYTAFGTTGTAAAPFNKGRTATHEIGHYFGLDHPWGADDSNCNTTANSDGVADTPATNNPYYNCPTFPSNTNACNTTANGSMFMNYMDYVNDACMYMFTLNQSTRMQTAMANGTYRKFLGTHGLCNTAPVPPTAAFTIPASGCVGNAVTAVNSSSGSPSPTYLWSSSPSTGVTFSSTTATAPTITFANTGNYTVTLVASSSAGSPSTSTKVITINNCVLSQCDTLVNPGDQLVNYTIPSANGGGYVAGNNGYSDKIKAEYHTQAGISGNRVTGVITYFYKNGNNGTGGSNTGTLSIELYNGNNTSGPAGAAVKSESVTLGTINTNGVQNQTILAYSHTFATPYTLTANEFFAGIKLPTTSGDTAVVYMMDTLNGPATNTAWEYWSSNAWYAFSNASAWGGNSTLGIFPIVCPASVGLAASELNSQISIFPNPSSGIINLAFALKNQSNVKIEVTNMLGQTVYSETDNNVSAETKTIRLNDAAKGVYLITVSTASEKLIRKVVIE
jgi:hypothetical protein